MDKVWQSMAAGKTNLPHSPGWVEQDDVYEAPANLANVTTGTYMFSVYTAWLLVVWESPLGYRKLHQTLVTFHWEPTFLDFHVNPK